MRVSAAARKLKRPYVRKHTNNAPGIVSPTSPPQIADLAFNIHGWALQDGMTWRNTYEIINAYKATMVKGGFEAKIHDLHEESQGDVYRHDLHYTQRELDPNLVKTDPSVCQYLVVGYTLQEEDPVYKDNKTFARYSENELVGETRPQPQNLILWDRVRTPILVVTPVKENTGTSVRLFGLVMPRSDLCQPVLLTHERIFYRWEFRASAGARAPQRNKNWNQVVIDKARELTPPDALLPREQTNLLIEPPIKRRRASVIDVKQEDDFRFTDDAPDHVDIDTADTFEVELSLENLFETLSQRFSTMVIPQGGSTILTTIKIGLTPESRGILNAIRVSNSSRIRQEVQASLVRAAMKARVEARSSNNVFQPFLIQGASMGISEAEIIAQEIGVLWPQMAPLVDAAALIRMKHVMNVNGQEISRIEVMEDFFGHALATLRMFPGMSDPELCHRIQEAIHTSALLNIYTLSDQANNVIGPDAIFLVTLLKEILLIHDSLSATLRGMFAGHIPSLLSLSSEHSLEIDVAEQTDASLQATFKVLLKEAEKRTGGADDILLWLERLRLRIRQV